MPIVSGLDIEDFDKVLTLTLTDPRSDVSLVNPILCSLIDGVCDDSSLLSKLGGSTHIIQKIWILLRMYWHKCITYGCRSWNPSCAGSSGLYYQRLCSGWGRWKFPEKSDINVSMMPFVIANNFEESRLPEYLRPYWNAMIFHGYCYYPEPTRFRNQDAHRKIGYISVHEGYVEPGTTPHKFGIRTHCLGKLKMKLDTSDGKYTCLKDKAELERAEDYEDILAMMGSGESIMRRTPFGDTSAWYMEHKGGIYMATNTPKACRIWNCRVGTDPQDKELMNAEGEVEHLRYWLPSGETDNDGGVEMMDEDIMHWLTDRTPLEWLPSTVGMYQQYFQLVLGDVSVWFEDCCTPNPHGVVPDPNKTKIIKQFY